MLDENVVANNASNATKLNAPITLTASTPTLTSTSTSTSATVLTTGLPLSSLSIVTVPPLSYHAPDVKVDSLSVDKLTKGLGDVGESVKVTEDPSLPIALPIASTIVASVDSLVTAHIEDATNKVLPAEPQQQQQQQAGRCTSKPKACHTISVTKLEASKSRAPKSLISSSCAGIALNYLFIARFVLFIPPPPHPKIIVASHYAPMVHWPRIGPYDLEDQDADDYRPLWEPQELDFLDNTYSPLHSSNEDGVPRSQ